MNRLILSLCDYTGNWPSFYAREDGYEVICVDLKNGMDARLMEYIDRPVHGILCAPDCNAFAGSGAQYWPAKDADGRTLEGLALVDACLRAVAIYRPYWWALELQIGHTFRSETRDTWPASMKGLRLRFEAGEIPKDRRKKRKTMCSVCAR